jgi:hypothetical protein
MITRKKGVINPPEQKEVAKERKRKRARRGEGILGKRQESRSAVVRKER